jgi:hypothetical protein
MTTRPPETAADDPADFRSSYALTAAPNKFNLIGVGERETTSGTCASAINCHVDRVFEGVSA